MITSKLSLKRINNIERQIKLYENNISEIIDEQNSVKLLNFKSNSGSTRIRDFYEFYINDKSLLNIISENYWTKSANENSEFFNTNIGCLGGFGYFWDDINICILRKKEFTKHQENELFRMFKSNYKTSKFSFSNQKTKDQIVTDVRNNFLFYCCQDCGDSGCGGISLDIKIINNYIIWTDNEKIEITFDLIEYTEVLKKYLIEIADNTR